MLYINKIKDLFIFYKLLKDNINSHREQIIYINSIIFQKFIIIKSTYSIKLNKRVYYVGCHVRVGDLCMYNNSSCHINKSIIKNINNIFNYTCNNRRCKLLLSSDSKTFISAAKNQIKNIITFKDSIEIIHSKIIDRISNLSGIIFHKIIGDIELLSLCNYLILTPSSTYSLILLYNNKIIKDKVNSYKLLNGKNEIYDPLYYHIKLRKQNCI